MGSGPEDIRDEELEREIVLLGELMAAAAGQSEHLSDARVDEVLGLARPRAADEPPGADEGEQPAQAAPGEQGPPDEGGPAS